MDQKNPRKHPAGWQKRDERAHPVIQDAIDKGYMQSGETYFIMNLPTHEAANQGRLSVTRGLEHYGLAKACRVVDQDGQPCWKDCIDANAPHGVSFVIRSKDSAREHIVRVTGGDPSKLKYNPYKKPGAGHFTDAGEWVQH